MKKGKRLKPGDTIGLVAPASPVEDKISVYNAEAAIKSFGFHVKMGPSCYGKYGGYLAGTPESRANDLNQMFTDPGINAILCLRGGYGSPQILNLLDYKGIGENPKLFIGYSDITSLHTAIGQKSELVTFHGPMAASDIAASDFDDYSKVCLLQALTEAKPLGRLENPPGDAFQCLVEGKARGKLTGGNLSLIVNTIGTPYEIDTKEKLLLLEDVRAEPYEIDRDLTQLALSGKLDEAAGFVIGDWANCESKVFPDGFTVRDVLEKIIVPYQKPAIYNVKAGHCEPKLTLPLGVEVSLDAKQKLLVVEESAVEM